MSILKSTNSCKKANINKNILIIKIILTIYCRLYINVYVYIQHLHIQINQNIILLSCTNVQITQYNCEKRQAYNNLTGIKICH